MNNFIPSTPQIFKVFTDFSNEENWDSENLSNLSKIHSTKYQILSLGLSDLESKLLITKLHCLLSNESFSSPSAQLLLSTPTPRFSFLRKSPRTHKVQSNHTSYKETWVSNAQVHSIIPQISSHFPLNHKLANLSGSEKHNSLHQLSLLPPTRFSRKYYPINVMQALTELGGTWAGGPPPAWRQPLCEDCNQTAPG